MLEKTVCTNLVRKLYFVYLLNVVDYVFTLMLISTGRFFEANPIARVIIDDLFMGVIIKCVVPFGFVYFLCRFMHILNLRELRFADMLISFSLTVYLVIMIDHLINFVLLIIN